MSLVSSRVRTKVAKGEYTPLWIRVWHWAVAVLFVILTYTGIALTFSTSKFALMNYELATTWHDVTGVGLTVLFVLFIVFASATGYWRIYADRWRGLLDRVYQQGRRVLTWSPRKRSQTPIGQRRLDTTLPFLLLCQQFLYLLSVVVLLPLLIITGLPYLYPELAPEKVMGFAGLWTIGVAHYVVGLFSTLFLVLHIYISTIAGFRRMIKGR